MVQIHSPANSDNSIQYGKIQVSHVFHSVIHKRTNRYRTHELNILSKYYSKQNRLHIVRLISGREISE